MISRLLRLQFRFLAFSNVDFNLRENLPQLLTYVFIVTWMVGIGRYWDHPNAELWQYAGLGSVLYVLVLSAFLYIIVLPLRPKRWSYRMALVFVGFTSLPALLYAIPVERFMPLRQAQLANVWFLGIVALWRLSLYIQFLEKAAGMRTFGILVATALPLSAIVVSLAALNLEHVIFNVMAGIREQSPSQNDTAYTAVITLGFVAIVAFPVTLLGYVVEIFWQWRRHKRKAPATDGAEAPGTTAE